MQDDKKNSRSAARLIRAASNEHWATARVLIQEYAQRLEVNLDFQNFNEEIDHLEQHYGEPDGVFVLAKGAEGILGCVGLRRFGADAAEMKRLYVKPEGRGAGLGRSLAIEIVAWAKKLGYKRVLLDTLPSMTKAKALYRALGFRESSAYRFNPVPGTVYMELVL